MRFLNNWPYDCVIEGESMRKILLAIALVVSTLGFMEPANANTLCADGTISFSSGRGACSWHGGIAGGAPSRNKSFGYNDPYGSSLGNSFGSTPKKKSFGYEDPYGSSLGNSFGSTPKQKSFGYNDPYGSSISKCSYIDRSRGRC